MMNAWMYLRLLIFYTHIFRAAIKINNIITPLGAPKGGHKKVLPHKTREIKVGRAQWGLQRRCDGMTLLLIEVQIVQK